MDALRLRRTTLDELRDNVGTPRRGNNVGQEEETTFGRIKRRRRQDFHSSILATGVLYIRRNYRRNNDYERSIIKTK